MGGRCVLSPADRAICDRDPALVGLPLMLDAQAMAAALGRDALQPAYLRYKPGVSCVASFLSTDGEALAAYAYAPDRYAEESRRSRWRDNPDVVMLPDRGVIVIPARLDRHLRSLARFLDPARRQDALRRVTGVQPHLAAGDLILLRYKPGRRLVARLDLDGQPRGVLKIMAGAGFDQALVGATAAMAHGQAALLGADSGLRAMMTAWVPGRPVCPQMTGHAPDADTCTRIGAALAALHVDPFRPAAAWTAPADARSVLTAATDLAPLDADLSVLAHDIATDLADRLAQATFDPVMVHGDFSADQVVMGADGPVILDWDNAGCGDPARDLGSFLARIDAQVVDGILSRVEADDITGAVLRGYGGGPVTLPLHHARALMLLVTEGFRARHPDWPARARTLLDRAAQVMRGASADPAMPQLDAALDPDQARPALQAATGLDLTGRPQLLRHKPGRRALVRYPTGGATTAILGKLRAKGTDGRMPAIHDALRGAGLDGRAPHGAGVPRARGIVDTMRMWLQDEVPGRPLTPTDVAAMARTGMALAHLHNVPPVTDRRWTHADELSVLDRALTQAAELLPARKAELRRILHAARDRMGRLRDDQHCGIHRDFYFDQVLIADAQVWLVDLDLYAVGDPAVDLGNFLAHLDEYALRTTGDVGALSASARAFLDGYAGIRPLPCPRRIATMRTLSLARHIRISLRFDDRRHTTDALIEQSLRACATCHQPT